MKLSTTHFIYDQWTKVPPVEQADLSGQTVVVVGANTGLGLEATKHFARMNPGRLILACRNEAKGQAAIATVEKDTAFVKSELWIIDLSKFSTIIAFAEKFEKDGGRLDILVMNAGIGVPNYEATADGYESTLQVNHLGTSLLSILLIPALLKTANNAAITSRLVVVSSDMHYWTEITKDEQASPSILAKLNDKVYCTQSVMRRRYQVTKLLNVFFTRALNAHISPTTPLVVNNTNPGFCYSELRRSLPLPLRMITGLMEKVLAYTTEEGSRQLVYAAIGGKDDSTKMRGAFVSLGEIREVGDFVLTEEGIEIQKRIWDETVDILAGIAPKVRDIVFSHLLATA